MSTVDASDFWLASSSVVTVVESDFLSASTVLSLLFPVLLSVDSFSSTDFVFSVALFALPPSPPAAAAASPSDDFFLAGFLFFLIFLLSSFCNSSWLKDLTFSLFLLVLVSVGAFSVTVSTCCGVVDSSENKDDVLCLPRRFFFFFCFSNLLASADNDTNELLVLDNALFDGLLLEGLDGLPLLAASANFCGCILSDLSDLGEFDAALLPLSFSRL